MDIQKQEQLEKKAQQLEQLGFSGIDASPAVSLYEYGLLVKKEDDYAEIIFGTDLETEQPEEYYNRFDYQLRSNIREELLNEDWFNEEEVANISGSSVEELKDKPLCSFLFDAIAHYGVHNVLSSRPRKMEIDEVIRIAENNNNNN